MIEVASVVPAGCAVSAVSAPCIVPTPTHEGTRLAGGADGTAALLGLLARSADSLADALSRNGPLPAGQPGQVGQAVAALLGPAVVPCDGLGPEAALRRLTRLLGRYELDLTHPHAAAHLQPPPLAVAVVADLLASSANTSVDTVDSGPAAIAVERWVIAALSRLAGLPPGADGVFTPGGSLSNLTGLMLARDHAARRRGVDARRDGIAALPGPVVLAGELGHFSVQRACAALGLGEASVRLVATDATRRMRVDALAAALRGLGPGRTPIAVVATAGTTDFGTVDPLTEIAEVATEHRVWLHVDAAYGFGALFSDQLAPRLAGLAAADSLTVDLHKLGWQPAAASALLVRDGGAFDVLEREVAYLNPADDTDAGYDGLLGRSLQTTRRADSLKVAATLLTLGRRGLGRMVDHCHRLARHAQARIEREPLLRLVGPAELTTVVFRYLPADPARADGINAELRRALLRSGRAVVGRTTVAGIGVCLKLTLLNPRAEPSDVDGLIDLVLRAAAAQEGPA